MTVFSTSSSVRDDQIAADVRRWYEENRERWRERFMRWQHPEDADLFMKSFIDEVVRVTEEAARQKAARDERTAREERLHPAARVASDKRLPKTRRRKKT